MQMISLMRRLLLPQSDNVSNLESKETTNSTNFDKAYAFTKKWEGGYVNDPADPGGETKFGISKRAYPTLNIKELTEDEAKAIYKKDYYDVLSCDSKELPWAVAVFDTAVNCGIARTILWLEDSNHDLAYFIQHRRHHYELIAQKNPKLQKFLKGWHRRVDALEKYIQGLPKEGVPESG